MKKRNDKDGFAPRPGEPGSEDEFAPGAENADADGAGDEASVVTDERVADLERRLAEQHDKYLRLVAEYDNYRKRTGKERAESYSRAQGDLAKQLLDALDDLARFAHVDPQTVDAATVVQGAEMVEKKLNKALTNAGLEVIDPVDLTFDPTLHEAVATEPALGPEDDHVVARVFQQGYLFNGQLLRPARVVVKQWNG
jgi:molecular chaperone GrpE